MDRAPSPRAPRAVSPLVYHRLSDLGAQTADGYAAQKLAAALL
ncbi:MAG: hypothetical protein AB7N61_12550 [Acidimicrobiia bacterium]